MTAGDPSRRPAQPIRREAEPVQRASLGADPKNTRGSSELRQRLLQLEAATAQLASRIERTHELLTYAATVIDPPTLPEESGRAGRQRSPRVDGPVLSLQEVGRRTGRHPDLLRRWSSSGRIPAIRVGRSWAIPEALLGEIAWPQSRKRSAILLTQTSAPTQDEKSEPRSVDADR